MPKKNSLTSKEYWKKREAYDKPGVRRRAAKKEGIKNSRKRDRANRNRDN